MRETLKALHGAIHAVDRMFYVNDCQECAVGRSPEWETVQRLAAALVADKDPVQAQHVRKAVQLVERATALGGCLLTQRQMRLLKDMEWWLRDWLETCGVRLDR